MVPNSYKHSRSAREWQERSATLLNSTCRPMPNKTPIVCMPSRFIKYVFVTSKQLHTSLLFAWGAEWQGRRWQCTPCPPAKAVNRSRRHKSLSSDLPQWKCLLRETPPLRTNQFRPTKTKMIVIVSCPRHSSYLIKPQSIALFLKVVESSLLCQSSDKKTLCVVPNSGWI